MERLLDVLEKELTCDFLFCGHALHGDYFFLRAFLKTKQKENSLVPTLAQALRLAIKNPGIKQTT